MNTQLFSPKRLASIRITRAQFSPLLRRGTTRATTDASPRASSPFALAATPVPAWQHSFLDRLQPAVTHYHE